MALDEALDRLLDDFGRKLRCLIKAKEALSLSGHEAPKIDIEPVQDENVAVKTLVDQFPWPVVPITGVPATVESSQCKERIFSKQSTATSSSWDPLRSQTRSTSVTQRRASRGEQVERVEAQLSSRSETITLHPVSGSASWSWEHRSGFRNYDVAANFRIEDAYWRGEERVRLKSGKGGTVPMEIWFKDMIQWDPTTGNKRSVQRDPPPPFWLRSRRYILSHMNGKRGSFEKYEKLRNQIVWKWDPQWAQDARLYQETGRCMAIQQSLWFAFCSFLAAALSTIWIGVDAELNNSHYLLDAEWPFQMVEYSFALFFLVELGIRFGAFRRKRDCLHDPWFRLDFALVVLSAFEIICFPILVSIEVLETGSSAQLAGDVSVLRTLRLFRLARIGRISRLLRQVPALVIMTRGVLQAGGTVLITLTMMATLLYIFAIIFKTQAEGYPELASELFPSITGSMLTLLIHGAFMDEPGTVLKHPAIMNSFFLTFVFLVFIFLSCFVVLNLLVGVLCDVVADVSVEEKEASDILFLRSTVWEMLPCYDKNDDQHLGKTEIDLLIQNPEMRVALNRFGVNVLGLVLSLDMYFENLRMEGQKEVLTYHEFLEFVMRLRAAKTTTVMDIVDLRDYLRQRLDRIELHVDSSAKRPREHSPMRHNISPAATLSTPVVPPKHEPVSLNVSADQPTQWQWSGRFTESTAPSDKALVTAAVDVERCSDTFMPCHVPSVST